MDTIYGVEVFTQSALQMFLQNELTYINVLPITASIFRAQLFVTHIGFVDRTMVLHDAVCVYVGLTGVEITPLSSTSHLFRICNVPVFTTSQPSSRLEHNQYMLTFYIHINLPNYLIHSLSTR
jgi:hypothetical protein